MQKVYLSEEKSVFGARLASRFREAGYEVVREPAPGLSFFIDLTDESLPSDGLSVGEGIDAGAAAEAYRRNVCLPLQRLDAAFPDMTGAKRICFLASRDASVEWSRATAGYGRLMARAALYQILTITKNTWLAKGYTFRLFDPMRGEADPEKAADAAFVYFTRDRYDDGPDNPDRNDEGNLLVRDAFGREIPW